MRRKPLAWHASLTRPKNLPALLDQFVGPPYVCRPPVRASPMTGPEAHIPTPPRPHPADIRGAIATAVAGGPAAELERLVREYVRALKAADVPPEQALTRVKAVVAVAPSASTPPSRSSDLATEVVRWFVAEYYRAD
jgi:hypothetical protein